MARWRVTIKRCKSCRIPFAPVGSAKPQGRGLCSQDYSRHERAGTLWRFPRATWRREELVAEARILRERRPDWTTARVAAELNVSKGALEQAEVRTRRLERARARERVAA